MAINFNGVNIPDFVKVNDISISAISPISQTRLKINGRPGSIDYGNEIEERTISATVSIIAEEPKDLKNKIREFTEWLYYNEPKKLILLDEPDKYYLAKFTGDSTFNESFKVGKGIVSFLCSDPFAYSVNEKEFIFNPADTIAYPFENEGQAAIYPYMRFEFIEPATTFTVATDEEFLLLGQEVSKTTQEPVDLNPLVLWDEMTSINTWTSAIYGTDAEPNAAQGTFKTNGYSFSVEDFGTNNGDWHGPAMVKALPRDIQDFKISFQVGFKASHANQLGRVECYFLDPNRQEFGKISINDVTEYNYYPQVEARAGSWGHVGSNYFVNSFGSYKGVFKNWYVGMMEIARRGNEWSAYFCIIDQQTGRQHTRMHNTWIDKGNLWINKLSSVQIHIGAYQEFAPNTGMYISDIKVRDESPSITTTDNKEAVPFLFNPGDILEIDNGKGLILKNGAPYYEDLDPASRFIKFKKGANGLTVSPPLVTANGKIVFRERWL